MIIYRNNNVEKVKPPATTSPENPGDSPGLPRTSAGPLRPAGCPSFDELGLRDGGDIPPGRLLFLTAQWFHAYGCWPVLISPSWYSLVRRPGKSPIGKEWGLVRPTASQLKAMYRRHEGAGVGLKLGAEGGVIDVDVDDPEHAADVLARMFPDGLPRTLGWGSARGFHLLFRWDDTLASYGKSIITGAVRPDGEVTGNPHYTGLEIRIGAPPGDARQLQSVIPPSPVGDGRPRRWNDGIDILPLPQSVFDDLDRYGREVSVPVRRSAAEGTASGGGRRPRRRGHGGLDKRERAIRYAKSCQGAIEGSHGSDQCYKVACKVGPGFDLDPEDALRILTEHYNSACDPPWSIDELSHKVADAYRNEPRRGWLL